MSVSIISENCYTCINCIVSKEICALHNKSILNIYKDCCRDYCRRTMLKCEICGQYVINLASHVKQYHQISMNEYKIQIQSKETKKVVLRRNSVWDY